jgi:glyoxylase-like metal-dependent hydrolase (beta-lactamase superfamily II)
MAERSLYEDVMASLPRGALPAARIKASAGIVPWRERDGRLEVFWVERSLNLPFMGGFFAFPGGGVARGDADIPVRGAPQGCDPPPRDPGLSEAVTEGVDLAPLLSEGVLGCVGREVFEEIGVLIGSCGNSPALPSARRRLLAGEASFAELLNSLGLELDASSLVYGGRWLTPPFGPVRFDNRFFLLEWPSARLQQPEVCGSELVWGEWIEPRRALDRWRRGELITAPPILHILTVLAEDGPKRGLPRLRDTAEANLGPLRRVEFRPGVVMFPLATPTLPPAGHTNAYALGTEEFVLIDPGSPHEEESSRLLAALAVLERQGRRLRAIWLTHHHSDHVGGVDAVREAFSVPVAAHRATAERLGGHGLRVDHFLRDGDRIELAGDPPLSVRVLHTPGHARGHLAFFEESQRSLLGGDLTAGIGTIVIDPPEGDMADYLGSLRRARNLGARTLFPAHGPPTIAVRQKFDEYLEHRAWREERIEASWSRGLRGTKLLVDVYDDVPEAALPLARRQLLAHLERLERSGTIPPGAAEAAVG